MTDFTIIVDDRENKPWDFSGVVPDSVNVVTDRLETGDYTVVGHRNDFAIERKSINDLASSLCSGNGRRERFKAEIERSKEMEEFEVYVEAPRWWLYQHQNTDNCPFYESNIHPNAVIGAIEKWPVIFRWCNDRDRAAWLAYSSLREWTMEYK